MNDQRESIRDEVERTRTIHPLCLPEAGFKGVITEEQLGEFPDPAQRKILFAMSKLESKADFANKHLIELYDHCRRLEEENIIQNIRLRSFWHIRWIAWLNAVLVTILIGVAIAILKGRL